MLGKGSRAGRTVVVATRIPADLRERLRPWIDVDEVGTDGLWLWPATVLRPLPASVGEGFRAGPTPWERIGELARDLVECARERARLTVAAEGDYRDNAALARRGRALEAEIETARRAVTSRVAGADPSGDGASADRYLRVKR